MKKKKSKKRIFIRSFVRSVVVVALLFLTGFTSYKISMFCFDTFGAPKSKKTAKLLQEIYGEVKIEKISKNLIYSVDKNKEIQGMVLEVLNTETHNLDYITIPMKSQFTISNELYQKLYASGSDTPQIIKLSQMDKYFSGDALYQYGVILLEDLLDVDIDYYTAVSRDSFVKMFKRGKAADEFAEDGTKISSYMEYKLRKSFVKKIQEFKDEGEWEDFFREIDKKSESNLSLKNKEKYIKDYQKVNPLLVHVHSLSGRLEGTKFRIDVEKSDMLLETILSNTASYTLNQEEETEETAKISLDCMIEILNGSQINGLAAEYKKLLEEEGYTVSAIGNYQGDLVSASEILVKDEKTGGDLCNYIKGASVRTEENLPEGVDIRIILGVDAKRE